ncbi:hypothetical protein [Amycolatopsis silviterrae]|uniref:Serine/threonine protein kinase n=1 Tax=Amycolatopsis silviterrae TaxID=1656914 RepID=A0ABW5GZC8_9PSEU
MTDTDEQPAKKDDQPKKSGWSEGHKWIAAIAALITAVAGIFIGRSSAPEPKAAPPVTVTQPPGTAPPAGTVTVTATVPAAETNSAAPVNGGAGVYSSEEIEWGSFNLDFRTPTYLADKYISPGYSNNLVAMGDAAKLAAWQTDSIPGKAECASAVAERGDNRTGALVKGNIVCGKTAENRIFRIEVLGVSERVTSKVVVWDK